MTSILFVNDPHNSTGFQEGNGRSVSSTISHRTYETVCLYLTWGNKVKMRLCETTILHLKSLLYERRYPPDSDFFNGTKTNDTKDIELTRVKK